MEKAIRLKLEMAAFYECKFDSVTSKVNLT